MRVGTNDIPLQRAATRTVAVPGYPWIFAMWMAVAAIIAVAAGLVLGILAALELGIGGERWTEAVQAHGRLQLFAFAGVFVVTLSFEFLARMNGRPPYPPVVRLGIPATLAVGAVLHAAGQVWHDALGPFGLLGAFVVLAAAIAFAVAVTQARPPHSLRRDPQPWFIWLAAGWLAVAAALSLVATFRWEAGVSLPIESHAVAEVFLRGFILQVIVAIGMRAFVGHLGLRPLVARRQLVILAAFNVSLLAWLAGQGLWDLPRADLLVRAADVLLAAGILVFTVWMGVLPLLAAGLRRGPRYAWQIPLAWLGVVAYAVALLFARLVPGTDLSLYQEGAIRHVFLLGFMLPLMIGMAHVVLARFGTGMIPSENALTASFIILLAAWPLRVLPALITGAPGETGQALMGTAGVLTMLALVLAAFVCVRTALGTGRRVQTILGAVH